MTLRVIVTVLAMAVLAVPPIVGAALAQGGAAADTGEVAR